MTTDITTIDQVRQQREQRIAANRQEYLRLLNIVAVNPHMKADDAAALDSILTTLGITLEDLDADLAAIRAVAAKESQRPTNEDLAALAQQRDQMQAESDKLTAVFKEAEAAMQKAHLAVQRARNRHTDALNKVRLASEQIIQIQNARPRAFGTWTTGAGVDTKMKLAS